MKLFKRLEIGPYGENNVEHLNAVDRNGRRYTTHNFAKDGDWWLSATILQPSTIAELKADGLLPLTEVKP